MIMKDLRKTLYLIIARVLITLRLVS